MLTEREPTLRLESRTLCSRTSQIAGDGDCAIMPVLASLLSSGASSRNAIQSFRRPTFITNSRSQSLYRSSSEAPRFFETSLEGRLLTLILHTRSSFLLIFQSFAPIKSNSFPYNLLASLVDRPRKPPTGYDSSDRRNRRREGTPCVRFRCAHPYNREVEATLSLITPRCLADDAMYCNAFVYHRVTRA